MTTIAYKDGVLAADTLAVKGNLIEGRMIKIRQREDGAMAGAYGSCVYVYEFLKWFTKNDTELMIPDNRDEKDSSGYGFIVRPNGTVEIFEFGTSFVIEAQYYAAGSGADFAYGAMAFGATAAEAVRTAIGLDAYSGGEITVLKHP